MFSDGYVSCGDRARRGRRGRHRATEGRATRRKRGHVLRRGRSTALTATLLAASVLLTSGTAAAATAATRFPRVPLWVYGHSYTISPGIMDTRGQEWMPKLARQLGMPSWRTFGVGSSRIIDTFGDLSRQAARRPVTGSAWTPDRHGVVVLQSEFNDMVNPSCATICRAMPLSAVQVADYGQTLQACLAILASSARADWSAAASSGGWRAASGSADLGGSLVYTTTPGAWRQMTVNVGRSGTVWLITWETDRSVLRGTGTGTTRITVDGRSRTGIPARAGTSQALFSRRGSGGIHHVSPRATRISGLAPGRHTIRISKADRGPGAVYLDQLLVQADAPVPVVVVKDPDPRTTGASWITRPANRSIVQANRRRLHAQIDAVTRSFPNTATTSLAAMPAADYGADGVHPDNSGMDFEAAQLATAVRGLLARYAPPAAFR